MSASTPPLPSSREQYGPLMHSLKALWSKDPQAALVASRRLCRTDLYFLLRYACKRIDLERDWLFDRCREVQESPDGHLDLWFRDGYKSPV